MAKSIKPKIEKQVILPPLSFGKKQSIFSGGTKNSLNTFVPKPVRITQHKGG
jgi:hypothetical protein